MRKSNLRLVLRRLNLRLKVDILPSHRVIKQHPIPVRRQYRQKLTIAASVPTAPTRFKVATTSAALNFAPRINKPKPTAPKPVSTFTSYTSTPVEKTAPPTGIAGIVRSAEPVLINQIEKKENQVILGKDGKPLAKAPAMLIGSKKVAGWKNQSDDAAKKRKKKKASPVM